MRNSNDLQLINQHHSEYINHETRLHDYSSDVLSDFLRSHDNCVSVREWTEFILGKDCQLSDICISRKVLWQERIPRDSCTVTTTDHCFMFNRRTNKCCSLKYYDTFSGSALWRLMFMPFCMTWKVVTEVNFFSEALEVSFGLWVNVDWSFMYHPGGSFT